jgi:predicted GNAT superfamily acetyltransferase
MDSAGDTARGTASELETRIRRVTAADVDAVVELASAVRLDRMHEAEARREGFLVSSFQHAEYVAFTERADHFYLLESAGEPVAFLLAYSAAHARPHDWMESLLSYLFETPYVVVKQICVRADQRSKGCARRLYEHLFDRVADDTALLGAVVEEPPNERSARFHRALGFRREFEIVPPDGLLRSLWRRPAADGSDPGLLLRVTPDGDER